MLPRFPATNQKRNAFSLIELLVVMAIIGILTTLAMSIGPGFLRSTAMSRSLSSVASAVSLARSEAVRSRKQTYFALAPAAGTLDERGFSAYAILRREDASGTNFTYVNPWKKLPAGVLFRPDAADTRNQLPPMDLPYPTDGGTPRSMRVISFVSDGSLEEETHPHPPVLPLQIGTRAGETAPPVYQGDYLTNQVFVERLSGKVKVERVGGP